MQPAKLFFGVFFASAALTVNAIIPIPCATVASLTARECCPAPTPLLGLDDAFANPGPCGANFDPPRGSCQPINIPESEYDSTEKDVRKKWPVQYFNRTCVCAVRFGGVDCGECSYGYNDEGINCENKTIYPRKSVSSLDKSEWEHYHSYLKKIKVEPSRYMVATDVFSDDPQAVMDSLVRPTIYDLFVWVHHFVAKDNNITQGTNNFVDYAHEGIGFPTWHRQLLLWMEREIQWGVDNHTFRIPYWDWRDPSQREYLFTKDRLGESVDGIVEGDLFDNWTTFCWEDTRGMQYPIPICNPVQSTNQILRRCPNPKLCQKENPNWPSASDVNKAISIEDYDAIPFDKNVNQSKTPSFRNFMEGFVLKSDGCGSDTLCTPISSDSDKPGITRKLHNSVHIILGAGDLQCNIAFEYQGAMSCVAASPNDPIFINHHAMVDCILENWIRRNKDSLYYPLCEEIRKGHRKNDYIVPFMPLYTHHDMFNTSDNFGYTCPDLFSAQTTLRASGYTFIISATLAAIALVMAVF